METPSKINLEIQCTGNGNFDILSVIDSNFLFGLVQVQNLNLKEKVLTNVEH